MSARALKTARRFPVEGTIAIDDPQSGGVVPGGGAVQTIPWEEVRAELFGRRNDPRFHPAAREEVREARLWYEERSPLAAVGFAQQIDGAVSQIATAPMRYPLAEHGTRRVVLHRFPHNVFYRIRPEEIIIVAVARQKRRPGYWSDR